MRKNGFLPTALRPALLLTALLACGCMSSPNSRFFVLPSTLPSGPGHELNLASTRHLVGILPVKLASYLNGPQIVTRIDDEEVKVDEFNRWGIPLADGIAATLATGMLMNLPETYVDVHPWAGSGTFDCQVSVHVLRFDGALGRNATLIAEWTVVRGRNPADIVARKISRYSLPVEGSDYPALTRTMTRLIISLAEDISAAIRESDVFNGKEVNPKSA